MTTATVRANDPTFGPRNLIDGDRNTYWATDDSVTIPEVVLEFDRRATFNIIRLRENIRLGQRIEAFELDRWDSGASKPLEQGTSIGSCRLLTPGGATTAKVRLRITRFPVCPALSEFGLYLQLR